MDASGNVYIADNENHVVRVVTRSTGIITTYAGLGGTSGSTGDGGPATSALLAGVQGVAIDASGNLFISDLHTNSIREVTSEWEAMPTSQPTTQPSRQPTVQPSRQPTSHPTSQPTDQPTSRPMAESSPYLAARRQWASPGLYTWKVPVGVSPLTPGEFGNEATSLPLAS